MGQTGPLAVQPRGRLSRHDPNTSDAKADYPRPKTEESGAVEIGLPGLSNNTDTGAPINCDIVKPF